MVNNTMKFPRILVIAPVKFNQETGSGVTMCNLFRDWPIENIAQIHSELYTKPDTSICNQYLYLPYYQIRQNNPRKTIYGILQQTCLFLLHRQESLAGYWLRLNHVMDWCRAFNPDLIYTRPHDHPSFYIWLPQKISQTLSIPIVTRILDDWPAKNENDPALARRLFWKFILRKEVETLFNQAVINIGISWEMCEAFTRRYGCQFVPFHNCIDTDEWKNVDKNYAFDKVFTLLYMGTVTKDKELQSLIDIKEVVLELRNRGYPLRMVIYGPQIYKETIDTHLTTPPAITYDGYFPIELKQTILSQADLLVLPINFDKKSQMYVGYSFQTKVPEYMASGTPVLVYGPPSNPNVRYAKRGKWALVVDQNDKKILTESILAMIEDRNKRTTLGQKARALAFEHHNAKVIRHQFQQIIINAAESKQDKKLE
jgi:glycosyltransferase involved in cell wall biosynthesis